MPYENIARYSAQTGVYLFNGRLDICMWPGLLIKGLTLIALISHA